MNVCEAAIKRVKFLFDELDNVLVAFSGGKDSTVCLNLAYDYAKETGCLNKLAMYHLDYEAQYQMTTDFVTETFNNFREIRKYWLCLPVVVIEKDISNRMASTVRHNRARGSHDIDLMVNIVAELKESGMSDAWILKHLGMDAEELLRLKQISGLASLFADKEFSDAWE